MDIWCEGCGRAKGGSTEWMISSNPNKALKNIIHDLLGTCDIKLIDINSVLLSSVQTCRSILVVLREVMSNVVDFLRMALLVHVYSLLKGERGMLTSFIPLANSGSFAAFSQILKKASLSGMHFSSHNRWKLALDCGSIISFQSLMRISLYLSSMLSSALSSWIPMRQS